MPKVLLKADDVGADGFEADDIEAESVGADDVDAFSEAGDLEVGEVEADAMSWVTTAGLRNTIWD